MDNGLFVRSNTRRCKHEFTSSQMIMKRILTLAFICISTFPAVGFSRIGETIAQCESRYGAHLKAADGDGGMIEETRLYTKNGFNIIVGFSHGVCQFAAYTKIDASPFTEVEQKGLLQADAGSSSWQALHDFSTNLKWQRLDGEVFAQYESLTKRMAFSSKACLAALNNAKDAKEKKAIEGF
jgi:hypothetical protein